MVEGAVWAQAHTNGLSSPLGLEPGKMLTVLLCFALARMGHHRCKDAQAIHNGSTRGMDRLQIPSLKVIPIASSSDRPALEILRIWMACIPLQGCCNLSRKRLTDAWGQRGMSSTCLPPESSQSHLGNVSGIQVRCGSLIRGPPDLPVLQDGHCIVANDGLQGSFSLLNTFIRSQALSPI